jgi:hypothetical protein
MAFIIQSTNPQDIIGIFVAPKYDAHCQAYREEKWLSDMKASNAAAMERVMAEIAIMAAERRARLRSIGK